MEISIIQVVIWVGLPIVMGLLVFIFKDLVIKKLDRLENKLEGTITENEVRQIISDKLDPLHEDISEIKHDIKALFVQNSTKGLLAKLGVLKDME